MGLFGSLLGWDQTMGAVNAVLASHLIEHASPSERQRIAKEVVDLVIRVRPRQQLNAVLEQVSNETRVAQMNFIALACDNLGIRPSVRNNVWTRVKNPSLVGDQVDASRISTAIQSIEKQDGVQVAWPTDDARVDFKKMYDEGELR